MMQSYLAISHQCRIYASLHSANIGLRLEQTKFENDRFSLTNFPLKTSSAIVRSENESKRYYW